jgi:exonuclease SbcD
MRLIHTSDWHIGKRFLEVDLLNDQARFCDWLVDVVKQESIEGVLIAGDIFDRAAPKAEAVDLVDDVLNRISALGASIVLISGNHDSAERLRFGSRFMAGAGLYVRTEEREIANVANPVTLTGRSGTSVEILPLPYLDPERVRAIEGYDRTHEAVLKAAIDQQFQRLINPARSIAMAHAFVVGGEESDSERQLSVGGTGQVSTSLFDEFSYVALGHLHRPQSMRGDQIVYSGSPLAYSFSEQHDKSIRILEVAETITSTELSVGVGRPVVTLKDTLDNLLDSSKYGSSKDCFVRAVLTDPDPRLGVMDRLRERFPHILEVQSQTFTRQLESLRHDKPDETFSPEAMVNRYLEDTFEDLNDQQREMVANALFAAVNEEEPA